MCIINKSLKIGFSVKCHEKSFAIFKKSKVKEKAKKQTKKKKILLLLFNFQNSMAVLSILFNFYKKIYMIVFYSCMMNHSNIKKNLFNNKKNSILI